ncbi:retrotransposable element tf2 protein type 1 [Plakobranchus ocellatus]|uniref:Retrotransposable element tf2 protein type 1 n=1 Tax=Plakobranchus ocellatus TaxID=259542 RepID=A0AAV4DS73_9GAST|nr:retrotransposable element tf2 protein type 1 [Plakobranchus ocellatus]
MAYSPRGGLKIESCKVFDRVSTLLRDSGCNTASRALIGNDLPISNNSTHFNVLDHFPDLPVRQREDPTLKPWFQRVGVPPVAGVSFRIEDGILKRLHTKSKFSSVQTTVAVPKSLRQVVLSYAHESVSAGHSGFRKTLSFIRDCFLGLVFVPMSGTTSPPAICARVDLALVEIGQHRSNITE